MNFQEAKKHFVKMASYWAEEMEEGDHQPASLEDLTADFQQYLADGLRGRSDVDPNHPVFNSRDK